MPHLERLDLHFFDLITFIGRSSGTRNLGATDTTPATLLREMERVGIEKAVVYHVLAREYDPGFGNSALLRSIQGEPRLVPSWVVMPHHTGEFPAPTDLLQDMRNSGVALAWMFPAYNARGHRFSTAEWCAGELLGALETARVPLVLDFTLFRRDEPPWRDIFEAATAHPRLPIVLAEAQGRNNRTLYPLLRVCPNLHVHASGLTVHRALEDFVGHFGAERLIFGSGYPRQSIGGARLQIECSRLSQPEKTLVAGGNLDRLIAQAWPGGWKVRDASH